MMGEGSGANPGMERQIEERGGPDPGAPPPVAFHRQMVSIWPAFGPRWPGPLVVSLVLSAGVAPADALLPGLPGAPAGRVGHLSALLSGICPQRPAHSYTLGGVQLPLEARMLDTSP